jgi:hypothetical protein
VIAATALPGEAPTVELGRAVLVRLPTTEGTEAYLNLRPETDVLVELSSPHAQMSVSATGDPSAAPSGPDARAAQGRNLPSGRKEAVYHVSVAAPGRSFAGFMARVLPVLMPLQHAQAPLELPSPAALQLTAGVTEFLLRTSGTERTVRVALAGSDAALRGASMKVHPANGAGAAETIRLRRGSDGTLEGEWLATAADAFKIAIVFDTAPGSAVAAMTTARGYMGLAIGQRVRLGRHQPINGKTLWDGSMDAYVGCLARISALAGYEIGQTDVALVEVDLPHRVDEPSFPWRVVSLEPVSDTEPQPAHCPG